uniref:Vegetative cell wall protein gp1-like n=1 Tax=Macrostomum lignano TaxID=282301 RepID=A0A1I8IZ20_9PLAT
MTIRRAAARPRVASPLAARGCWAAPCGGHQRQPAVPPHQPAAGAPAAAPGEPSGTRLTWPAGRSPCTATRCPATGPWRTGRSAACRRLRRARRTACARTPCTCACPTTWPWPWPTRCACTTSRWPDRPSAAPRPGTRGGALGRLHDQQLSAFTSETLSMSEPEPLGHACGRPCSASTRTSARLRSPGQAPLASTARCSAWRCPAAWAPWRCWSRCRPTASTCCTLATAPPSSAAATTSCGTRTSSPKSTEPTIPPSSSASCAPIRSASATSFGAPTCCAPPAACCSCPPPTTPCRSTTTPRLTSPPSPTSPRSRLQATTGSSSWPPTACGTTCRPRTLSPLSEPPSTAAPSASAEAAAAAAATRKKSRRAGAAAPTLPRC